jgi:hypothetical protein
MQEPAGGQMSVVTPTNIVAVIQEGLSNGGHRDTLGAADTPGSVNHKLTETRCEKCGTLLTLLWIDGDWVFYRCETHGTVVRTLQARQAEVESDAQLRR